MPWYTNATITCKVLNKIASRYNRAALHELNACMDNAVELILKKQEQYHAANHR